MEGLLTKYTNMIKGLMQSPWLVIDADSRMLEDFENSAGDKRKRVCSVMERDQRRAQNLTGSMLDSKFKSDLENRLGSRRSLQSKYGQDHRALLNNQWAKSRSPSVYSSPVGNWDQLKVWRNTRAAPQHIIGSRQSSNQLRNKDKIKMLNRQQQLLQQQGEHRIKFNESLLGNRLARHRSNQSSRESLHKLGKRSMSNGWLTNRDGYTGRRPVSVTSLTEDNKEIKKEDDKMSDKINSETVVPSQGQMSRASNQASEKTTKSQDFSENVHLEGQGNLNDSDNPDKKTK